MSGMLLLRDQDQVWDRESERLACRRQPTAMRGNRRTRNNATLLVGDNPTDATESSMLLQLLLAHVIAPILVRCFKGSKPAIDGQR